MTQKGRVFLGGLTAAVAVCLILLISSETAVDARQGACPHIPSEGNLTRIDDLRLPSPHMKFLCAIGSVAILVFAPKADTACVTIAEAIQRVKPGPLKVSKISEVAPVPFDEIVAGSDLIVEGVVQPIRTFISEDGCDLYTDYALSPRDVLAGKLRSPGQPGPSLVVRQWGGELIVEGVKVTYTNGDIAPFKAGQVVLLFLTRLKGSSTEIYRPYRGFAGAFEITDGRARALAEAADVVHGNFARLPKGDFTAEIKRLKR